MLRVEDRIDLVAIGFLAMVFFGGGFFGNEFLAVDFFVAAFFGVGFLGVTFFAVVFLMTDRFMVGFLFVILRGLDLAMKRWILEHLSGNRNYGRTGQFGRYNLPIAVVVAIAPVELVER